MNIEEFSDAQWRDILDEFRSLLVRAGYADWDEAMAASLEDEDERGDDARFDRRPRRPAIEDLRAYTSAFVAHLKEASSDAIERRSERLGSLLRTESGEAVRGFEVDYEGTMRSLQSDAVDPDAMIAELNGFLAEINGDDGGFWRRRPIRT